MRLEFLWRLALCRVLLLASPLSACAPPPDLRSEVHHPGPCTMETNDYAGSDEAPSRPAPAACFVEPCTLQIERMAVVLNRIPAHNINEFLEEAAESGGSGNEIGSFSWSLNAAPSRTEFRLVHLTAAGVTTLPYMAADTAPVADEALIQTAEQMIAAHEARHRDAFLAVAGTACRAMSRTLGDTRPIFRKYFCETGPGSNAAAQRDVDLADGLTRLVVASDGTKSLQSARADYAAETYLAPGLCD